MTSMIAAATTSAPASNPLTSTRRLSILHVLAPAEAGGLETVVLLLGDRQRAAGHAVTIAALVEAAREPHPFVVRAREVGLAVEVIATPARGYLTQRSRLARLQERLTPDVVHSHGYQADVISATLHRHAGSVLVTTVHGFTGGDRRNRLYERLQRFAFRRFDAVVAVSRKLGAELQRGHRGRVHVAANAYGRAHALLDREAARQRLGLSAGASEFRIGWIGRLSVEKGADVMVRALAQLGDVPLRLSILGHGPEGAGLRALARELGVDERITWHGTVADAGRVHRAFDAVVMSSRTEGTPMVLLEAMAARRPIVATRVGGIPDVVGSEEALLVAPDDPDALADAIRLLVQDLDGRERRATAAEERLSREYSLDGWLERYDAIYDTALCRRTGALHE